MKKLLLTSAIVAIAGAAAAEVTWSGDAEVGYRSHTDAGAEVVDNGMYFEGGVNASASAELDNGITATIDYDLDIYYDIEGGDNDLSSSEGFPTLTLESSVATFTVGEINNAADDMWADVDGMAYGFVEDDDRLVARLDTTVGGTTVGVSYVIDDTYGAGTSEDSYAIGLSGTASIAKFTAGYQYDDAADFGAYGVSAGFEMSGADVVLSYYGDDSDASSLGLGVAYATAGGIEIAASVAQNTTPAGVDSIGYDVSAGFNAMGADITLGYKDNNTDLGEDDGVYGDEGVYLDASYAVTPEVTILAGYDATEADVIAITDGDAVKDSMGAFYVGTKYDLGGGAEVFASYATAHEMDPDEWINTGATLGVAFTF